MRERAEAPRFYRVRAGWRGSFRWVLRVRKINGASTQRSAGRQVQKADQGVRSQIGLGLLGGDWGLYAKHVKQVACLRLAAASNSYLEK